MAFEKKLPLIVPEKETSSPTGIEQIIEAAGGENADLFLKDAPGPQEMEVITQKNWDVILKRKSEMLELLHKTASTSLEETEKLIEQTRPQLEISINNLEDVDLRHSLKIFLKEFDTLTKENTDDMSEIALAQSLKKLKEIEENLENNKKNSLKEQLKSLEIHLLTCIYYAQIERKRNSEKAQKYLEERDNL